MPFLGRDWRSPGDTWMRSDEGWLLAKEWRLQFLENLNDNIHLRLLQCPCHVGGTSAEDSCLPYDQSSIHLHQPYIVVPKGITQERKALVCANDAFASLDFESAVKDHRRFKYVCKVLECMITYKFADLSGTTHNKLVKLLEVACQTVLKSETNVHVVDRLLRTYIDACRSSLRTIGSGSRHQKNTETIQGLRQAIHGFQPTPRSEDGQLTLTDLPEEMLRDILRRLTDHVDLLHTGGAQSNLYSLVQDDMLWRDLCKFHFTGDQLRCVLKNESLDDQNYKLLYRRLVKRFGTKELFAQTLHICSYCRAVYWPSHGHPCAHITTDEERDSNPPKAPLCVTPEMFITLFFPM